MSRILTGDRPTGPLHLGHYFGTLANRVRLQREGYEIFVVIADYQVIADRDHPGDIRAAVNGLVLDYLASGLDPDESVVFAHSTVPELNQLLLPFLSLVNMGELSRNPTIKDEIALAGRATVSGLMLTYPVHQAADILFCKADLVPVGRDQLPHLELTRSIARRFNGRYGEVFPLPDPLLGEIPLLLGLDGRKMSKSLGNAIALSDPPDVIATKIRAARTDSERTITFEPDRRPEVANLLRIAALCSGADPVALAADIGEGGSGALKGVATDAVVEFLRPMQNRRAGYDDGDVQRILARGSQVANEVAAVTLDEVRSAMGFPERIRASTRL
jgi:tryptophanyl-tRNA synthetase